MRYLVVVLLLGTVLTIAPQAPLQAAKAPGSGGGQNETPAGSWLLYDDHDQNVPAFGPFRAEGGCLRLAQTLNQYAMADADDPYVCREKGSPPEAKAQSEGWIVYDSNNTAIFGRFGSQAPCDQLARTLNKLALDEADDPYACRAASK
jgi:hypothetical protein